MSIERGGEGRSFRDRVKDFLTTEPEVPAFFTPDDPTQPGYRTRVSEVVEGWEETAIPSSDEPWTMED